MASYNIKEAFLHHIYFHPWYGWFFSCWWKEYVEMRTPVIHWAHLNVMF